MTSPCRTRTNICMVATLILGALLCGAPTLAARREAPLPQRHMARLFSPKTFIVFDWDENIFKLPTSSALFARGEFAAKAEPRLFLVSSSELSLFKGDIGLPGTPLEKLELIGDDIDPMNGSFRFTRPGGHRNYMLEDMAAVVFANGSIRSTVPTEAKAPFFELYVARESKLETRDGDRILTGRGQTGDEFFNAVSLLANVRELREKGFEAPSLDRVTLVGGKGPASKLKAIDLIDRLQEATAKGYTLFVFPDDDPMNVRKAAEALAKVPQTIAVWVIWTREHGDSRLIDLSKLPVGATDIEIKAMLDQSLDVNGGDRKSSNHDSERAALFCRAAFF